MLLFFCCRAVFVCTLALAAQDQEVVLTLTSLPLTFVDSCSSKATFKAFLQVGHAVLILIFQSIGIKIKVSVCVVCVSKNCHLN